MYLNLTKNSTQSFIVLALVSFLITWAYFFNNEALTIYGDDLQYYLDHKDGHTIRGLFTDLAYVGKYRPVASFFANLNYLLFDKDMHAYFMFNVCVQSLILCAFTYTVNVLTQNLFLAWLLALPVGLSRFAHYNNYQIFTGGPMEGLGELVFIIALYNIFVFLLDRENTTRSSMKYLLWALFFVNLDVYIHERYISALPFVPLLALFYPLKNKLRPTQKLIVASTTLLLVVLNVCIKIYGLHTNFFHGTGGDVNMTFNIDRSLGFLQDAILSIVQYNSGELGWMGQNFASVPVVHQLIAFIVIEFILMVLIVFFITAPRKSDATQNENSRYLLASLFVLMFFCLLSAVSTLKLEQRWLQAPFAVFFLIVIYAFYNIRVKFSLTKNIFFAVFVTYFMVSDYYFYQSYKKYSYWTGGEMTALVFKEACTNGVIRKDTKDLFFIVENRWTFGHTAFDWVLASGGFFQFYQGASKKFIYLDVNMFTDKDQLPFLQNFNKKNEQAIKWTNGYLVDVTDEIMNEWQSKMAVKAAQN